MPKNTLAAVIVILLLVVAGWYFMRPKASNITNTYSTQTETPQATTSTTPSASEGAAMMEAKEVKVSATDYAFSPSTLSVKKGQKVKIILQNDGKFPHNLLIDELSVATKIINAGQTDTVEFTASKTGSFSMYCSVDSHRQKGMEGTVSVQ